MKFSLKRIWAVILIRNREFYRDLGALGWVILFPLLMVLAFGYVFNVDEGESYKVGYWGNYPTHEIENIQWIKYDSRQEALDKLKKQKIDVVYTLDQLPPIIWTAKSSPKSKMAKKLLHLHLLEKKNLPFYEEKIEGRVLSYVDWVFPGIVTLNVMFMGLWGVGWVIVRQRKLGVLKRFKASPLTAFEYLLAQMISRLFVMVVSSALVFMVANWINPFNVQGSYFDMLVVFSLGCLALSSIGLIFAARISSEELCNGLLNFITYPIMFVSEIWFSLEGSAELVKSFAHFSPLWHMTTGIRKIMYEGANLADLAGSLTVLVATALFFTSIGSLLFKWTKD